MPKAGRLVSQPLSQQINTGPYIAYDGTFGNPWTVVVRLWDAKRTVWSGIATCGQIARSGEHAVELVKLNGPWPEGAEFVAHEPGSPIGAMVWGR